MAFVGFLATAISGNLDVDSDTATAQVWMGDDETSILNITGEIDGSASDPIISKDGRRVVFSVARFNEELGFSQRDYYLYDRLTGETVQISDGEYAHTSTTIAADISDDGKTVIYDMAVAPNQTHIFLYDVESGITTIAVENVSRSQPKISGDGTKIVFFGTGSSFSEFDETVFVYDIETDEIEPVNFNLEGYEEYEPVFWGESQRALNISGDGNVVVFAGSLNDPVEQIANYQVPAVVAHSRDTGVTELLTQDVDGEMANGYPGNNPPSITSDGRYVLFNTSSPNLVEEDTISGSVNLYLYDRELESIEIVNVIQTIIPGGGEQYVYPTYPNDLSEDGRYVLFDTGAPLYFDLEGDNRDILLKDRITGEFYHISQNIDGEYGDLWSAYGSLSADGVVGVFQSRATNLIVGEEGDADSDIYLFYGPCPYDLTGDGVINSGDLGAFLANFGLAGENPADFDGNGVVNSGDLGSMLQAMGAGSCIALEQQGLAVQMDTELSEPQMLSSNTSYNFKLSLQAKQNTEGGLKIYTLPDFVTIESVAANTRGLKIYKDDAIGLPKGLSQDKMVNLYFTISLPESLCEKYQNRELRQLQLCK